MNNMEFSLVLFTVLSQVAVGLTVMMALRRWRVSEGPSSSPLRSEWTFAGLLLVAALVAAHFHLGHPFSSARALLHLSTSWLSRETLIFMVFLALIVVVFLNMRKESGKPWLLIKITALVGIVSVVVSGKVYAPPSFPALNNGLPIMFYMVTAFILGSAFSSYFAGEDKQPMLVAILTVSLIVGLIVNLIIPSVWLSGGRVMQATGSAYYGSTLFWLRMIFEFGLGLAVVGTTRKIPVWLPVVLLAGELVGRVMIFTHVTHTATNMGGLY